MSRPSDADRAAATAVLAGMAGGMTVHTAPGPSPHRGKALAAVALVALGLAQGMIGAPSALAVPGDAPEPTPVAMTLPRVADDFDMNTIIDMARSNPTPTIVLDVRGMLRTPGARKQFLADADAQFPGAWTSSRDAALLAAAVGGGEIRNSAESGVASPVDSSSADATFCLGAVNSGPALDPARAAERFTGLPDGMALQGAPGRNAVVRHLLIHEALGHCGDRGLEQTLSARDELRQAVSEHRAEILATLVEAKLDGGTALPRAFATMRAWAPVDQAAPDQPGGLVSGATYLLSGSIRAAADWADARLARPATDPGNLRNMGIADIQAAADHLTAQLAPDAATFAQQRDGLIAAQAARPDAAPPERLAGPIRDGVVDATASWAGELNADLAALAKGRVTRSGGPAWHVAMAAQDALLPGPPDVVQPAAAAPAPVHEATGEDAAAQAWTDAWRAAGVRVLNSDADLRGRLGIRDTATFAPGYDVDRLLERCCASHPDDRWLRTEFEQAVGEIMEGPGVRATL